PRLIKDYEEVTNITTNIIDGTITYVDEDGETTVININELIGQHETLTTLVDNENGTFTYTDENGDPFILDIKTLEVTVQDNVYTFTNAAGEVVVEIDINSDAISYNNTTSNLDATN